jgi:response regulator RpfG family c-di-GMP phosphodiesterase
MQHRYVVFSVIGAAEQQAWSEIEGVAHNVLSSLKTHGPDPGAALDQDQQLAANLTAVRKPGVADVTLVDPRWRILFPPNEAQAAAGAQGRSESTVTWTPLAQQSAGTGSYKRGRAMLPDGPHLAMLGELEAGRGYVLVHQAVGTVEAKADALVQSLPALSVMTFVWVCALLSVAAYMVLARLHDQIERQRSRSASDALRKTQNLLRMRDAVIFGLAKLAESRDPETGDHLERISVYSTYLASALRRHPKFRDQVTPAFVRLIGISSALHDIGKVGVKDRILRKRGPLTREERATMQTHAAIGGECLREIERRLGGSNFLQMAREIAFAHHENWDGSGYPKGLAGAGIPLSARIVAVADMYDALASKRVYKEPLAHEECVATMRNESGRKFDPDLVEVWLTIESKFRSIAGQYSPGAPAAMTGMPLGPGSQTEFTAEDEDLCASSTSASR